MLAEQFYMFNIYNYTKSVSDILILGRLCEGARVKKKKKCNEHVRNVE